MRVTSIFNSRKFFTDTKRLKSVQEDPKRSTIFLFSSKHNIRISKSCVKFFKCPNLNNNINLEINFIIFLFLKRNYCEITNYRIGNCETGKQKHNAAGLNSAHSFINDRLPLFPGPVFYLLRRRFGR